MCLAFSTDNFDPFVLIYRGHTLLVLRDQKAKSEAFFSVVNPLAYTGRCFASVDVLLPSLQYREIAISSKNTSVATYNLYPDAVLIAQMLAIGNGSYGIPAYPFA